ncbi:hypothetical protein IV498_12165 [Paenarthrobacter sp. Z7-10]|uniref:hypothetical protein n=1 Tax=Paenarthrobacter sp. Z7-10 TaxID=2787635 RepID=UPI0022A97E8C|nr:hypothetical protein [Paenarthrobacter sp. Z7-10]MCZ2403914.1 hypothetical protein [Paenarthrobacter sp. Z7-10]
MRFWGGRFRAGRSEEEGSAVLEFVFLAVLLMIPVVYFILTLGQLQGGAFTAAGAADQAAKVYVIAVDPGTARAAAEQAVLLAMADAGLAPANAQLKISCRPADCLAPGSTVTATVTIAIELPLIPSLPGVNLRVAQLRSAASATVGRFR